MKLPFTFDKNIRIHHLIQNQGVVFAIYFICLLPTILLLFSIVEKKASYGELSSEVEYLAVKMEKVKELQKDKGLFFKTYQDVEPHYVSGVIESDQFLKPEEDALRLAVNHPAFEACQDIKKRLHHLESGANRLQFHEKNRKFKHQMEEVELSQVRPVELNHVDLKRLLVNIEGISTHEKEQANGRPQLTVKRFLLNKNKHSDRETYQLEMQLIKREKIS